MAKEELVIDALVVGGLLAGLVPGVAMGCESCVVSASGVWFVHGPVVGGQGAPRVLARGLTGPRVGLQMAVLPPTGALDWSMPVGCARGYVRCGGR